MSDLVPIQFPQCGETRFKATSGNPKPDDIVTCAACGHALTRDELAALHAAKVIENFPGLGNQSISL